MCACRDVGGRRDSRLPLACSRVLSIFLDGDVLVHTGDFFTSLRMDEDFESKVSEMNAFFGSAQHKHKVFVAGNHEIAFSELSRGEIQRRLSNCVYLQDSSVVLEGLVFYGSPWTNSVRMGFSMSSKRLDDVWARIPEDTDVLLTHMPPFQVLDLAYEPRRDERRGRRRGHRWHKSSLERSRSGDRLGDGQADRVGDRPDSDGDRVKHLQVRGQIADWPRCQSCGARHERCFVHWGHAGLASRVARLRPAVHIFGHVHNSSGIARSRHGTLYLNASQDLASCK